MKHIFAMKQERAEVTKSIRDIIDEFEGKEMPAEKQEEITKLEARYDDLYAKILTEEKQIEREKAIAEVTDGIAVPVKKSEVSELFARALTGEPEHMSEYRNALDLSTDATAGYLTAPVQFVEEVIKGLDNILFMRNISRVVGPIGAAQSLGFPYRSTEGTDATWVGEVVTAPEESTLAFGRREFKPNKMAKLIKVSRTLIQHATMAESAVRDEMIYRIGIGAENAYMNGNGSTQPLGIFTASDDGIPTTRDVSTDNTATTVTFDGLQNAKYSLKQQYHANASWVMHRDLAKMLAKIKDGEGQYVWQGSVQNGQPDRLLGAPVYMSEYAPNTYTSALYAAVFGDFRQGYWICDADAIAVQVLKELYAATNQIGYLFDYFGDGAPVLAEAFARVKMG